MGERVSNYEKGIRKLGKQLYKSHHAKIAEFLKVNGSYSEQTTSELIDMLKPLKAVDKALAVADAKDLLRFLKNTEENFVIRALRFLHIKKLMEYGGGRYLALHEFISNDWHLSSDQRKVMHLHECMEGWEFKEIVSLADKHTCFIEEKKKKGGETYSKYSTTGFGTIHRKIYPVMGPPEIKKLLINDYLKLQEELGMPFADKSAKNKHKPNQLKIDSMWKTTGIENLFHIYGALASVKYLDLFYQRTKEENEKAALRQEKKRLNEKMSNYKELESLFQEEEEEHRAESLKRRSEIYTIYADGNFDLYYPLYLESLQRFKERENILSPPYLRVAEEKEALSYLELFNLIPDSCLLPLESKKPTQEKIIFFSAVKRVRTIKGMTKSNLYTLLIYLYERFANNEEWRKSYASLPNIGDDYEEAHKYEFADLLVYGTSPTDAPEYNRSKFLCDVEEFEEKKGKWEDLEHFFRDRYFINA